MASMRDQSKPTANLFHREVHQMPEGYYSGDRPNPKLRAFVESHIKENPYDPETDDYKVPAFDKPIETTKATAIYNMHTYWSKKPHDAIGQYIKHFTKPGDLVLDPLCGSGGTALAALIEGRKAIAIDRSPAATFITKNYCTLVDVDQVIKAFEELKRKLKQEIDWLYETRCDRCGRKALTNYIVYSHLFKCPRCLAKVALFDCIEEESVTLKGEPKKISACPNCHKQGIVEEISARNEKFKAVPVMVSYRCEGGCKPASGIRRHNDIKQGKREYFEKYDMGKLVEINNKQIRYWLPSNRMMNVPQEQKRWALLWRPYHGDIKYVIDFFEKRVLWALSLILSTIKSMDMPENIKSILLFTFSSCVLGLSKMLRESNTAIMEGVLYMPPTYKEIHVLKSFLNKGRSIVLGQTGLANSQQSTSLIISTQSCTNMNEIVSNSVDYIFTDPPYSSKRQYGELNFIWESWLQLDTNWHDDEIIVNEMRGKSESDWANLMRKAMTECFRVLKPGRWISLCYHDTSEGTWALVQDIMAECGFVTDQSASAIYIDTKQKSIKQRTADKVNKRDLVINFRKPKPGETAYQVSITGTEDGRTFNEKVRVIIRDYLEVSPGATKDRIYDEAVSRMVRAGQMQAHNFEELLRQVAEPAGEHGHAAERWYLKEAELEVVDQAESAKEDAAAVSIQSFCAGYLKKYPDQEGVHYSDIFEHFIYAVKDKPRRPLAEWLYDFFYKTDQGTFRPPVSEEEERLKAEGRSKGTHRRIKRYLAYFEQGLAAPKPERPSDATLAEWIRHCKRSGLFEQGKLLYEKGGLNLDNLPEETVVGVEEDYQVCVRQLSRR